MVTLKQTIQEWFDRGVQQAASHMLVACDTFDYEDYPVYIQPGESSRDRAKNLGDKVMECYDLSMDRDAQLAEHRAFHWGPEVDISQN